jgi:hypothetical protein
MEILRAGNLAIRFLLELGALASLAYWGATTATGRPAQLALAITLPVAVAVLWGLFISPKARVSTGPVGRAVLGLLVFLLATTALWSRGRSVMAITYGALAVVSSVLSFVWPQPASGVAAR